jgi:hypothetical protein
VSADHLPQLVRLFVHRYIPQNLKKMDRKCAVEISKHFIDWLYEKEFSNIPLYKYEFSPDHKIRHPIIENERNLILRDKKEIDEKLSKLCVYDKHTDEYMQLEESKQTLDKKLSLIDENEGETFAQIVIANNQPQAKKQKKGHVKRQKSIVARNSSQKRKLNPSNQDLKSKSFRLPDADSKRDSLQMSQQNKSRKAMQVPPNFIIPPEMEKFFVPNFPDEDTDAQ